MFTPKNLETICIMKKLHSIYPIRALLNDQSVVLKEDIFQHHMKKLLLVGTKHRGYGFGE